MDPNLKDPVTVAATRTARPPLDMNRLRALVLASQRDGQPLAHSAERQIVVDREGNIYVGRDRTPVAGPLSQVHTGTFAASSRIARDRALAVERLPSNTTWIDEDGVQGFLFTIQTELGDPFTMFLFHDGTGYQVEVVDPALEEDHDPHQIHLFTNGLICWGEPMGIGLATLEMAFAKSVLWANGVSVYLHTRRFPFSANNVPR